MRHRCICCSDYFGMKFTLYTRLMDHMGATAVGKLWSSIGKVGATQRACCRGAGVGRLYSGTPGARVAGERNKWFYILLTGVVCGVQIL